MLGHGQFGTPIGALAAAPASPELALIDDDGEVLTDGDGEILIAET